MELNKLKRVFYEEIISSYKYDKKQNKIILRIEATEAPNQFLGPFRNPNFFLKKEEKRTIRLEFYDVEILKEDKLMKDIFIDWIKPINNFKSIEIDCFDNGIPPRYVRFNSSGFSFKYLYLPKKKQEELSEKKLLFYKWSYDKQVYLNKKSFY